MKGRMSISRRNLLKLTGAALAAASAAGCSSSDDKESIVSPADNIVYDKEEKIFHTTGAYNCGSRCVHKVHVKNGRILKFTSAGDKMMGAEADAAAEYDSSELGKPMELRACVRCYGGYQGLVYQPDRLKYPLMRIDKTKERGDVNNFRRATWEEATDAVVDAMVETIRNADSSGLKYYPIMTRFFMWPTMARAYGALTKPFISMIGNESFGGVDLGTYDTVGMTTYINSRTDRFNTKFMISWALDVTRTTYWNIHTHFMNSKIKEKTHGDIPMVVISSTCSDAAAILSTGLSYTYSIGSNPSKTVNIPGWIPCRPGTDSALAIAMMYVIYKTGRMSADYMQKTGTSDQSARKVFGFWKDDEVVSQAPLGTPEQPGMGRTTYYVKAPVDITGTEGYNADGAALAKGSAFTGFKFKAPAGESFEEYLLSREVEWAGKPAAAGTTGHKYQVPADVAVAGDAGYQRVLEYVASITGVRWDIIEALAHQYSAWSNHPADAAFIETGGGAQRAWNASEWVWSMICLSAMCGYIPKKGGGIAGMSMSHFPDYLCLNPAGATSVPYGSGGGAHPEMQAGIAVELSNWQHLVLTGKDHRSKEQMVDDITNHQKNASFTSADLPLKVDMIIHTNLNNLHTHPNVAKNVAAYKSPRVKHVVVMDQVMTPTALHADIILPATTHLEQESYATPTSTTGFAFFHRDQVIDKMYDTKTEREIQQIITDKLNARLNAQVPMFSFAPFDNFPAAEYSAVKLTDYYTQNIQNITLPTADELKTRENGLFMLEIPKDKPLRPMYDLIKAGELDTSTGFLNFYSPLRAMRPGSRIASGSQIESFLYMPGGWRNATVCYQPMMQGREYYFDNKNPLTGKFTGYRSPFNPQRVYKMTYMTNKSRNRGHTVFDNVAAIKDEFPQMAKMNPKDAAERGISEGDMVYVYNDRGCMKVPAHLSHSILPGVVSIEHGAWYRADPVEKVTVWMQDGSDTANPDAFHAVKVAVDVGGSDNTLTNDYFGEDSVYMSGACPAQSGPCEISLVKPE